MPGLTIDPRIEFLTKVAGLAGSAIAVSKVAYSYVNDFTFKRKIAKAAADIDSMLPQLAKMKCDPWQQDPVLESYAQHLEEELQCNLKRLMDLKAESQRRAARRNEEPQGVRRWLLLYRPEGGEGLIMQGFFYISLITMLLMIAFLPIAGLYSIFILPFLVLVVGSGLFERAIALRMKRVGNAVRLKHVAHPNCDLKGFYRVFALYSWRDGQWFSRGAFYLFVMGVVYVLIRWARSLLKVEVIDHWSWQEGLFFTVPLLFCAQLFRVQALSQRAKRRMFPKADLVTSGVAEAAPTV